MKLTLPIFIICVVIAAGFTLAIAPRSADVPEIEVTADSAGAVEVVKTMEVAVPAEMVEIIQAVEASASPTDTGAQLAENPVGPAAENPQAVEQKWQDIDFGFNSLGNPITAKIWGDGARIVLVLCNIHGDEHTTAVCEYFMQQVAALPETVPSGLSIVVVPQLNPMGTRTNANGINLNGDFSFGNPAPAFTQPETASVRDFVMGHTVIGALSFHAFEPGYLMPGDAEESVTTPRAFALAYAMVEKMQGYKVYVRPADKMPIGGFERKWLVSVGVPAIGIEVILDSSNNPDSAVQWGGFTVFLTELAK